MRRCVAFCNEEGKLDRPRALEPNDAATGLWAMAIERRGGMAIGDTLVGNIAVLWGDRQNSWRHYKQKRPPADEAGVSAQGWALCAPERPGQSPGPGRRAKFISEAHFGALISATTGLL